MNAKPNALVTALLVMHAVAANGDVLYRNTKAIALGKGKLEKNIIHWTYCNGKTGDFKKPPHTFVTGEHCKIQPDAFGIKEVDGQFFVQDEKVFDQFFPGAAKGDRVGFSADSKSIKMDYKGERLVVYRSPSSDRKD
jgi:hypothetical protein